MWKPSEEVKVIRADKYVFTIESFYDDEFKGDRYSFIVSYPGGTHISAGYGHENEIVMPTFDIALDQAIQAMAGFDKELYKKLRREISLDILLD
jgi:hypothetical protein